jgi:hypothetical protein
VKIAVQLDPPKTSGTPIEVAYKWDSDTDILSAQLTPATPSEGMSGSVGVEGADGSWLILDVASGRINGVEIAVWPEIRKLPSLSPPSTIEDAHVSIPARRSQPNIASMETVTRLVAETDPAGKTYHFRLGKPKLCRTIRLAKDVLLDVDDKSQISGLWLLNVPPSPAPVDL